MTPGQRYGSERMTEETSARAILAAVAEEGMREGAAILGDKIHIEMVLPEQSEF